MGTLARAAALALLVASLGCAPEDVPAPAPRLGVPPALEPALRTAPWPEGRFWSTAPLRPYSRARDLETLLLSTRSRAFDGVVVPGRTVLLYERWVPPYPADLLPLLRGDLKPAFGGGTGLVALPLTVDAPVLVYRQDWWTAHELPPPSNLPGLREALLILRARGLAVGRPLVTSVPSPALFWSLLSSEEGEVREALHRYAPVHTLEFLREFQLEALTPRDALGELERGRAAAAFVLASDAQRLLSDGRTDGAQFVAAPLPSRAGAASVFDGWCLVGPGPGGRDRAHLESLLSPSVQRHLAERGFCPSASAVAAPGGTAYAALGRTRLILAPGGGTAALLEGALADVLQGGVEPEVALRRAEARREALSGRAP